LTMEGGRVLSDCQDGVLKIHARMPLRGPTGVIESFCHRRNTSKESPNN
jgi:hypothetical protein